MQLRRRTCLTILLIACLFQVLVIPSASSAATITFSDQTFSPTNWSLATQTTLNGGTASAQQISTTGGPPYSWQVNISVNNGDGSAVYAFSLDKQARYTPSTQGAISLLSYGENINTSGAGQEFGPAALQDGNYYYAYAGSGATSGWESISNSYTSANFSTAAGSSPPLNFTASGDPIEFGFVSINNTNLSSFSSVADYENWSVTLTTVTVPEPSAMALLLAAGVLLRRRR